MAVTFTDAIHGWIVGADGCVFASSNAGDSWTPQTSGTTGLLEDVVFTDALTGWIVGADGLLLQTADGGATWTSRTLGTTLGLHAVAFAGSTGLLVGDSGVIFRTIDGGATWNFQAASGKALYDVRFLDRQTVRAVGVEGQILVSFNQGQNWITEVSGTDADLLSLCAGEGWTYWIAGARGTILRTSNDGFTWQAQDSGTTGTFHAITLDGMDRIRAVGDAGSSFVNNP
jgi:photosystem II stability/assembly factor-like uncharacterized protein